MENDIGSFLLFSEAFTTFVMPLAEQRAVTPPFAATSEAEAIWFLRLAQALWFGVVTRATPCRSR
jgi:hypothetical protein